MLACEPACVHEDVVTLPVRPSGPDIGVARQEPRPTSRADDRVSELLTTVLAYREERWQGEFSGEGGSTKNVEFEFDATLQLWGSGLSGTGSLLGPPPPEDALTFAGTREGHALDLLVWFDFPDISVKPFVCTGRLSADEREISGTFAVECLHPDECGCAGGTGSFRMHRSVTGGTAESPPSF